MTPYANLNGGSNVKEYDDSEPGAITVVFRGGRWRTYVYTDGSAGAAAVAQMKRLAAAGRGLNSYIGRVVKKGYASRS